MPELIEKDGKHFWAFPELPFDVARQTETLLNYYLRTDPATGEIDETRWLTYPNNATPRKLLPVLEYLQTLTDLNTTMLADEPGMADWGQMVTENDRWRQRLDFYVMTVTGILAEDPDVMAGDSSNPLSLELANNVVNPLLLGWYPNDLEPFSTMPRPYSGQNVRSVMDLYFPYSQANQLAISLAVMAALWDDFVEDLKQRANVVINYAAGAISLLPIAVAFGIGFAVFSKLKK